MKNKVVNCLKIFLNEVNVDGNIIMEFFSHGGKEFNNFCVHKMLHSKGINIRVGIPYTPQQNGFSESGSERSVMDVLIKLWAKAVNTAAYVFNFTVKSKALTEVWLKN